MNPPFYEDALNQQGYNPATDKDGRNNHENSNLLPQQSSNNGSALASRKPKIILTITILLGFFLITAISMIIVTFRFHFKRDQGRIGREWNAEERAHQVIRDTWKLERQAMVVARESWQLERANITLEREAMAAERERWRKELSRATGSSTSLNLRALHGGGDLTIRYSLIYSQLFMTWLMTSTGLCRTGNPCAFPCTVVRGLCNLYMNNDLFQRYESVLVNLQRDDNWRVMCATTPKIVVTYHLWNFDRPSSCARWVR